MKISDIQNTCQSGNGRILAIILLSLIAVMGLVVSPIYNGIDQDRRRLHSEAIDRYQEKYNGAYLLIVTNLAAQYATERNASSVVDCSAHSLRHQILLWDITDYFDHKLFYPDNAARAAYLRNLFHGYGEPFINSINNYTGSVLITTAQADIMVSRSHPPPSIEMLTNMSLSVILIEENIYKEGPEYTDEKWNGQGMHWKFGGKAAWLTIYTWPERELVCRSFLYPYFPNSVNLSYSRQFSWKYYFNDWLLDKLPLQGTHTIMH